MADYDVTAPDGRTFTVTAPDGASQDQVLAYAQAQYAKMPPKRPAMADIGGGKLFSAIGDLPVTALHALDKAAYGAGGKVTDLTGSPAAGVAANLITGQAPLMAAGGLAGLLAKVPLRATAERLMQSALKPDAAARVPGFGGAPSEAKIASRVMLDEGANASEAGVAGLRQKVIEGKADINKAVADADAAGATVSRDAIAANQPAVEAAFQRSMDPARREANLETIRNRYLDWRTDPSIPERIPVSQAQALKEGEQAYLRNAKQFGKPTNDADIAVSKDMAHRMRMQLEEAIPELAKLNQREKDLITTLAIADKRAALAANANITGPFPLLANNPAAAAAIMLDRSSLFKSILARMVNAASENAPALGAAAGAAYPQNKGGSRD